MTPSHGVKAAMIEKPGDLRSTQGKRPTIEAHADLLVIGGGPAGLAAALEGRRLGRKTMLVDENPIAAEVMGEDVPQLFGQKMTGAVRNRNAMLEAVVESNPLIAEAFEAEVAVQLGVSCWGLYQNGPDVGWLPGLVAGLASASEAWLVRADQVIVATGRRDMGLAFPGWETPGVLGLTAALRLATTYNALDARRVVLLGTNTEALTGALVLVAAGVEVVAILEQAAAPVGPRHLLDALQREGVRFLCGRSMKSVEGAGSVEAAVVRSVGASQDADVAEQRIECDAIILGVGTVPVIELLAAAGCKVEFSTARGGFVPIVDAAQRTSVPGISAVGDCAGIWSGKSIDASVAQGEGRRSVAFGVADQDIDAPGYDLDRYRLDWVRACVIEAQGEPHVCRCEEVTAREILGVKPPRYLGSSSPFLRNAQDLASLLGDGSPHPDQIKRLTRAGMGICQGRRCREQVAGLLALEAGVSLSDIPLASYRAPVRPLSLSLLAEAHEDPELTRHWVTWFGMPQQFEPFWKISPQYTVAGRDIGEATASE